MKKDHTLTSYASISTAIAIAASTCLAVEPAITNISLSDSSILLQWDVPTNRFIVESIDSLHRPWSAGDCVSSSVGLYSESSAFTFDGNAGFFRLHFGLEAVQFADANFQDAVIDNIPTKLPPSNRVYDVETSAVTNIYHWGEQITTLGGIQAFPNLTSLTIWDNSVSDISALASLANLTHLDLSDNNIADITALAGMTALTHLDLYDNYITNIVPLAGLTNLVFLDLRDNGGNYTGYLSDIRPLSNLVNLSSLNLEDNRITDLGALVLNAQAGGLSTGVTIRVRFNPLSTFAKTNQIPLLRSYGVTVIE